jgi:hypothetical protein
MSFALDCRVRVTGLAAAAAQHHNGKAATVCGDFDKSTGRFIVLLDDGSQLAVKPINLQIADASQAAAAARIAGKPDIVEAAGSGDHALVADHLLVDPTRARTRLSG